MRLAYIENGIVRNIIEANDKIPGYTASDTAAIGDTFDGVKFQKPVKIEPVPETITKFQAKAALLQMGKLADFQALVDRDSDLIRLAWAETNTFHRSSPGLVRLSKAAGLTDKQLDDLFILASKITV